MNDCIWSWINGCDNCRCDKYLSADSEKGESLLRAYQEQIEEAIEPIKQEFLQKHYV